VQCGDRLGRPGGGAQRPHEDRDVLQRVAQRPDDVRITDPALRPGPFDPRAAGLVARDRPHGVAVGDEVLGEMQAAAAAADEEHAHERAESRRAAEMPRVPPR
jgi:hypothetical protein